MEARQVVPSSRRAHCVFEHIYFSRPDTRLEGRVLQQVRGRMGEILWREAPVEADLVISVPDSGNPAANGFARASGIPQDDGLIKNRYVARTFIQPGQELRQRGLRMKFNPLPGDRRRQARGRRGRLDRARQHDPPDRRHAEGRGSEGGAPADLLAADPPSLPLRDRHVHQRGDDRPRATVEEIAGELGADSLAYLSMEGVYEAVGAPRSTTATRASPATTRSATAARETASSRSRGDRRLAASRPDAVRGRRVTVPHCRPRLRRRGPTSRRSSTGCTAGTGSRSWRGLEQARREGAGAAADAGVETGVFVRADHPDRASRDAAIADWLAQRGRWT